jgi:hypothetical protein
MSGAAGSDSDGKTFRSISELWQTELGALGQCCGSLAQGSPSLRAGTDFDESKEVKSSSKKPKKKTPAKASVDDADKEGSADAKAGGCRMLELPLTICSPRKLQVAPVVVQEGRFVLGCECCGCLCLHAMRAADLACPHSEH